MQFGIQFFPSVGPDEKTAEVYYDESLAIAEIAEKLGFDHFRTVEHYFHRYGGYSPNPIVFLTALSQRTRTARLVTGAILPVFNNPMKLAGEIGMLDALSKGRLDVGFARAFLPQEFRRFNISPDESNARFREGLEQIELLLTAEDVTHLGQFHTIRNVTSFPRPTQQPRPKFYIAATQTAESFEYAGRNGYSIMAIPIANIRPLLESYRDAWRKAGHPGNGEVMVAFHMLCHDDDAQARAIADKPFKQYFEALVEVSSEWTDGRSSKDYRDYDKSMAKMKAATLESQIEAGGAWIGNPDTIKKTIGRALDMIGPFEHASLQVNFGNLGVAEAERSLRMFAKEVMPTFILSQAPSDMTRVARAI